MKLFFIALFSFLITFISAQETSISPYSAFGYGEKKFYIDATTQGMAGTNTAYQSNLANEFNFANPASNRNLDFTSFELGIGSDFSSFEENGEKAQSSSTYLARMSLAFPIGDKTRAGINFQPYSAVGYNINVNQSPTQTNNFTGNGSLNSLQVAGSRNLGENLSIGLSASFLFGRINRSQEISITGSQLRTVFEDEIDLSGGYFTAGLLYNKELKKDVYLSLGAVYSIGTNMTSDATSATLTYDDLDGTDERFNINIINIDRNKNQLDFPSLFSAGLEIGSERKWRLSAQFDWETTKDFTFSTNSSNAAPIQPTEDTYKVAVGGSWIPNENSYKSYFDKITYRAGLYAQDSPIQIENENVFIYGVTLGLGLPIGKDAPSEINIFSNFGQRSPQANGFLKENFANVGIGILLTDKWFRRRKIE